MIKEVTCIVPTKHRYHVLEWKGQQLPLNAITHALHWLAAYPEPNKLIKKKYLSAEVLPFLLEHKFVLDNGENVIVNDAKLPEATKMYDKFNADDGEYSEIDLTGEDEQEDEERVLRLLRNQKDQLYHVLLSSYVMGRCNLYFRELPSVSCLFRCIKNFLANNQSYCKNATSETPLCDFLNGLKLVDHIEGFLYDCVVIAVSKRNFEAVTALNDVVIN